MAVKKQKPQLDTIVIEGELQNFVSYATYYCRQPLFTAFRIFNNGDSAFENIVISVSGSTNLILPAEIIIAQIPAQSSIEVTAQNILNPKYLADIEEPQNCTVSVKCVNGKAVICDLAAEVVALPIDYWSGILGNTEMLASFVRPKIADCQKILAEAGLQLKTWGYSSEWSGYSGNDKNSVRNAVAAIYTAIRRLNIERAEQPDLTHNVSTGDVTKIIPSKSATPLELALFVASCFEATKLNPIILVGKEKIGVGVWLYESCFTSTVQDDMDVIEKYISDGVNNLAIFDIDDIFAHKNASFTTSESHFLNALRKNMLEICVDIKRCRIGGVFPLPLKVKQGKHYELLTDEKFSYDEKPKDLIDAGKFALDKAITKDKAWQRRLLDLSMKNNLLNFRYGKDALHITAFDLAELCQKIDEAEKFTLLPTIVPKSDTVYFGSAEKNKNLAELISIELTSGNMRVYSSEATLNENAQALIRKAKISEEEVGAKSLYLAFGFLKWKNQGEKDEKYAPLVMLPVTLKRSKTAGITLEKAEDYQVNTTLLEFLKQEFGIDVRGLEGKVLSVPEILAVFRAQTANLKGWEVYSDVYLSQFTFARYAMWADVKNNIEEYKKNPIIASLLSNTNKLENNALSAESEDEANPISVLTPLPCDSSQYAAVAESEKGTTFVLHGPPGTGKSQTITNIIANAVDKGKRVLFVAEKQAALQVVKKRLNEIGIGEFCLELHSGKSANKTEIVRSIENTLSLTATAESEKFSSTAEKIVEVKNTLSQPLKALHKKRRLGVSVYEGILYYLQNKNAPELVNIESTFYDSLTKKKLEECEKMLLTAQAAAKDCGGVHRSPFDNVNLTVCDDKIKNSVLVAAEVVIAELKHLKNYLGLFIDTFNQKLSTFTYKKLENLIEIATILKEESLSHFFMCNEEQFYKFYNASVRYDRGVKHWLSYFKTLPDVSKFLPHIESELENWGENYRSSKILLSVIKRINKCGTVIPKSGEVEWIKNAYEIEQAKAQILSNTNLSSNFLAFGGGINDKKREEFMRPLYKLHQLCAQTFMDYNADSFNSVCVNASNGYLKPLLTGLVSAAIAFVKSADSFCKVIKANKSLILDEDVFDYYSSKCGALIDNIDMLPAWCMYKATAKRLNDSGLVFITDAMESGRISGEQILASFRKNVYRNFIQTNIPADDCLSTFSANILDESAASFSVMLEEFSRLTKEKIRADLISRLPKPETEGSLALELMSFQRSVKGNLRGFNIRAMFAEIPELLKVVSPCMLMSPYTVSQYLPADSELFDIVIFDEASQLPTCEAVPSLARAKSAIVVGDPKQMPPTAFFMGSGADEENLEVEDLESVLEDCLALGMPEKHLNWHYRSKHESLIAFSNVMYYSGRLCTFPSPDAMDSKVSLRYIETGVYDRGMTKCNRQEAEALVAEVIRRLKDEKLKRSSIGIVTFSTPQQVYIERMLNKAISENGLEDAAYEREEPLFIKNLENVQGDERDVILFSVCYGPDKYGRISLNFGPLNQFGGWRRLNVAVSRAREEMVIFSSMRYSMIDLSRTTSRGVAGLKSFLEFAEKGRTSISVKSDEIILNKTSIGKYVAEELSHYGYECRCDLGVSDFKIDVAVVDPKNKHNYILAILCDGTENFSIKDRTVMQVQTLKRNNWNVIRLYSINFFNNPKREIKKIKEFLDKLTSDAKLSGISYKKPYRVAKCEEKSVDSAYILSGENDAEITKVIKAVLNAEEPISEQFLIKRALSIFGISKFGVKLEGKMRSLIKNCSFNGCDLLGNTYYFKTDKFFSFDKYRVEENTQLRVSDTDFTPFDIISLIKGILLNKVSLYSDELISAVIREIKAPRTSDKLISLINSCIDYGVCEGLFIRSISDRISLS
ncbi:MAG: DUF4011 domain-containing protein [Clostridiales bacterium]|nr:DUF4011 domain-containing protein [Clostridiales bacterium]